MPTVLDRIALGSPLRKTPEMEVGCTAISPRTWVTTMIVSVGLARLVVEICARPDSRPTDTSLLVALLRRVVQALA